jgi:hypothetical protein
MASASVSVTGPAANCVSGTLPATSPVACIEVLSETTPPGEVFCSIETAPADPLRPDGGNSIGRLLPPAGPGGGNCASKCGAASMMAAWHKTLQ